MTDLAPAPATPPHRTASNRRLSTLIVVGALWLGYLASPGRTEPAEIGARVLYTFGLACALEGDYQSAIAFWRYLLRTRNEHLSPASRLKVCKKLVAAYHRVADYQASLEYLRIVCELSPDDTNACRVRVRDRLMALIGRTPAKAAADSEPQREDAEVPILVGVALYGGRGVKQDPATAVECWRRGAESGDPRAQVLLGSAYYEGQGVERDLPKAVEWWLRAANQGDAEAQYNLGVALAKARGVERDLPEAVRRWRQAAAQGHALARRMVSLAEPETSGQCDNKGEAR